MEKITDERGTISTIAEGVFRTIQVIESKKGAIRANHWHKTDSHVMYLLSGKARYVETLTSPEGAVIDRIVGPGDTIDTPPINPHAMEFLEDSVMVVCAVNARNFDSYTNDIVRVRLL